jgi:hypothetical protein
MKSYLIRSLLPRITVHCWGGYGSQLVCLFFVWRLEKQMNRRIQIVFHTSGVTYRKLEIEPFLGSIQFRIIDDFAKSQIGQNSTKDEFEISRLSFKSKAAQLVKFLLNNFGFVLTPSDRFSSSLLEKTRPWTISIRHHYSNEMLTEEVLHQFIKSCKQVSLISPLCASPPLPMTLHFRLGDLLSITEKDPVSVERLARCVSSAISGSEVMSLAVFSDSPTEAEKLMRKNVDESTRIESVSTSDVHTEICKMASSEIFIGTNSKISMFAAIFCVQLNSGVAYLPIELKNQLITYTKELRNSSGYKFYN